MMAFQKLTVGPHPEVSSCQPVTNTIPLEDVRGASKKQAYERRCRGD